MSECPRCVRLRTMTDEQVMQFFAPLMKGQHWQQVAQPDRLREIAIRKHVAQHGLPAPPSKKVAP